MKIQAITPSRISLFGGGSDLPPFSSKYGGIVINMAINIRQKLTLYSDEDLYEFPYTKAPLKADKEFLYKALDEFGIDGMHHSSIKSEYEGEIASGLGSSASCMVGLVGAINKRLKLGLNREQIAQKAWEIETERIGHYGGKQDQYAAVLGGLNVIEFNDKVTALTLSNDIAYQLTQGLILFHTGIKRESKKIQDGFKDLSESQIEKLIKIKEVALRSLDYLVKADIEALGNLLDTAWQFKKLSNNGISNPEIDILYEKGIKSGAYGGKLLGSGGGGYMVFMVDPKLKEQIIEELDIEAIDFSPDFNGLEVRKL